MKKIIKENKFTIILFLLAFITRLIYILTINTPIISDFKTMYEASLELLNKTNNYTKTPYFIMWGYQTGHVFYQYLLLKICNSVTFLKIINSIITSLTVVFIYLITSKNCTKTNSKIISLLYLFFPFPLFLNSVLSNQQLPLLLILISIYIFLNIDYNKYIKKSILIGLILGLSNILRSEAIIIIFSIILYQILQIKKIPIKKIILSTIIILISYLSIFKGTSYIFKIENISQNGLNNSNPYWKFVLGFNYETNGAYSNDDAMLYASNKEEAKKEVINRIKKIDKIPKLFLKKTKKIWFESDMSWSIGHISNTKFYKTINIINQIFIITFITLSILSIKNLFKNQAYTLSFIILTVYFGVYLLIEVMARYAYNLQAFLAILSCYGLDTIIKKKKK